MDIEDKTRIDTLKTAAIVLNTLANSFKDDKAKQETKSLAWVVTWAVEELERLKK